MATEARKFQVGLFVIGATMLMIGAAIWLGATHFFEQKEFFVAYFNESVQGLDPGAAVKYRGVPAGRVEQTRIAPDGNLIEVVMSLDSGVAERVQKEPDVRAQLQLAGITGLRYVEIDRQSGDALNKNPTITFRPPYPVIPSTPSSVKAIAEALEDVYTKVMSVDLEGISNDVRSTMQSANQLLRDERVSDALTQLRTVAVTANTLATNLEQMTAGVKLAPAVQSLNQATSEVKALFADLRSGPTGQQLRETLARMDQLAQNAQEFVIGLQGSAERLDHAIQNLERTTDEIRQQPSRLLFAAPPAPERPEDGRGE